MQLPGSSKLAPITPASARRDFLRAWCSAHLPRGQFWLLVASTLLFNIGIAGYFFLYNLFLLDLGLREQSMGLIAGALAIGSVAATFPAGVLSGRYGARRVLSVCLALLAVSLIARACLLWYPAQLLGSFIGGAAICGWSVCLFPAVAASTTEPHRPAAYSILFCSAVAGGSMGALAGSALPGWLRTLAAHHMAHALSALQAKQLTLILGSFVVALAIVPALCLRRTASQPTVRAAWHLTPFLTRFLAASACWSAAMGLFTPFVTVFFARYLQVPLVRLGVILTIAQLAQAVSVLVTPFVLRRAGLIPGISLTQLVSASTLGLLALSRNPLHAAVLFCLYRAAMHMADPGIQTLLMDRVPAESRSNASAMNYLVTCLAQAAAAAAAGFSFAHLRYPIVLAGIAVSAVVAAILFSRIDAPHPEEALSAAPSGEPIPLA